MNNSDPVTCRRALREIAEIAAVARLQDSQMSGQEALAAISAIADWVIDAAPRAEADCGGVVARIEALTHGIDLETLDDSSATRLFGRVVGLLSATPHPEPEDDRSLGLTMASDQTPAPDPRQPSPADQSPADEVRSP